MERQVKVLITDAGYKHTLGAVRSLGRAGFHVTALSSDHRAVSFFSRYKRYGHSSPGPIHFAPLVIVPGKVLNILTPEIFIVLKCHSAPISYGLGECWESTCRRVCRWKNRRPWIKSVYNDCR